MPHENWPRLDGHDWRATRDALHLYLQIVGKYRLARTPWQNHSWHATFHLAARGWTTTPIPDGPGIEILFDLIDHKVIGTGTSGGRAEIKLRPMTVAAFHAAFHALVSALGGTPRFHGVPNEVADPVPFALDHRERPYDGPAVNRFFRATASADRVFKRFRSGFLGKASPSHLFWGSFDLAVTRFSGRAAPPHPGGVPALPDEVAREAYDQELSSAGFWPGGPGFDAPAFYAYAYPSPEGFAGSRVHPDAAFWSPELGEFLLPYEAVRTAPDPDAALRDFLQSTYDPAADLGGWDRAALECAPGRPSRVRPPAGEPPRAEPSDAAGAIRHEAGPKGRYTLSVDGHEAEMTYTRVGVHLLIIDHTGVPDALRGRGIGAQLVGRAVEDARRAGDQILPLCPFALAQMQRHPEWHDVLQG